MCTQSLRYRSWISVSAASALALLAGAAAAQDSVSRNANGGSGLPGDGLSPWTGSAVRTNYIVDLASFTTASGTQFGIAPVMKSGHPNAAKFTAFNGSSSISQTTKLNAAYPVAGSYLLWTAPGGGTNTAENDTTLNQSVTPTGLSSVFAVGFMDFDEVLVSTTNVFVNQLYGGQIAFDPAAPDRLFVSRVNAATNAGISATDRSQFGYGSIDADGNLCFRADSFGSAGPATSLIVGDNYFRIKIPARTAAVNVIDNAGGSAGAATEWVMQRNTVTHATPASISQDRAGRSVLVGADFVGNYRYESSALSVVSTTSHRPGTTDHRGSISISGAAVYPGSIGTGGVLGRSTTGTGKADSLTIFGVGTDGSVASARTFKLPAQLVDACDSFAWPIGGGDFRNYGSQVTFRGGTGPVAVTKDQAGRCIAASVIYNGGSTSTSSPFNAIAAVRFDPTNAQSVPTWTTMAWVNSTTLTGKDLQGDYGADGIPNTHDAGEGDGVIDNLDASIGRLASMSELPDGFTGPSISSPTFDSAGNAYFVAAVALKRRVGPQNPYDFKLALIRAQYRPATFCYALDVMAEAGQVFHGRNSNRNYRLAALNLADADSISTASIWSGSATQMPWNNIDNSALPPAAPQNLGGLVLSARIVYDTNNDGQYNDPTAIGGDVNSVDEAYNVVMYVGNVDPNVGPPCPADYNQDGGVDGADVEAFFVDWSNGQSAADVNQDGGIDGGDVEAFFRAWEAGGC
jgi:hypothetical protein